MISWLLGLLMADFLRRRQYYGIANFRIIGSNTRYSFIGIGAFKWIVTKTFYRHLNQNIKLSATPTLDECTEVRKAMTHSEWLHRIAFWLVVTIGIPITLVQGLYRQVVPLLLLNVILNLYPVLLQQYNKRRLDKVILGVKKHQLAALR
ncbi:glycosyl-4,4'-diaponeurosporenoate acyltransferase CrtO family protein [Pontibacter akesuensis]|nr:hypothetical protein [Pontibacter akesuensis]